MERLHQVVRAFALFICCALSLSAAPKGACSLTVRVLSPDGRRPEVPISVKEESGRVQEKDQENDDVQFCDLGILPVMVTVGSDGLCNQVTVHDVPVAWDEPYLLTVTYDPEVCSRQHAPPPPVPLCRILFRFSDSTGRRIPDAFVKFSSPTSDAMQADPYGRAEFVAKVGDEVRGSVVAAGFGPSDFRWKCSRSEPLHEQNVKLEKR
jgi:hypothetical protein